MALMWPSTAFLSYDSVFHISRRHIKMFLGDILKYFFNSTYSVFIPSHVYIYTLFLVLIITMVISGTLVGSTPVQPNLVVETNGNSGNSSIQVSLSFSSSLSPLLQSPLSSFDSKDDLAQVSLASPPPADFPKNAQVFWFLFISTNFRSKLQQSSVSIVFFLFTFIFLGSTSFRVFSASLSFPKV